MGYRFQFKWCLIVAMIASGCTTRVTSPTPTLASPSETAPAPTASATVTADNIEPTPEGDASEEAYYDVREVPYLPLHPGLWWNDAVLIDFDTDGDLDILVIHIDADTWEPTPAKVLANDGSGAFQDVTKDMYPEQEVYSIGTNRLLVADFNGDGRDDAYFADQGQDREPGGGNRNTILIQTSDGRLDDQTEQRIPAISEFTHDASAADVDGDGDIDIYNCNVYGGESGAHLYINDGDGFFTNGSSQIPHSLVTLERKFTSSLFVDVDNDGDMDLILGNHGGGLASEVSARDALLINDGAGNFGFAPEDAMPVRFGGPTWGVNRMAAGDFDTDGWTDLIMGVHNNYRYSYLQLLLNNGDGTYRDATDRIPQEQIDRAVFGINVADLNEDGMLDFVVGSDLQFKLYMNEGNASFVDATHILPIERTDLRPILPGDLDEDGDMDLFILTLESHYYVALNIRPFELPGGE